MTEPTHLLVPNFICDQYRLGVSRGSFQGAALFVDLSGFSKMTDALSLHGQHGAEVLADMMRVVFEPMVNAVFAQGGFVIGFSGDAFNAVFPEKEDTDPAMIRCLSSAFAMQAHTKSHSQLSTPYGTFSIHIKVGIGFGETKWQIFKSVDGSHATYWFRGDSLSGAVAGEEIARAGDIIADAVSYGILKDVVHAVPVDDCHLIQAVDVDLPAPCSFSAPKPADDLAGIFFPKSITHLNVVGEFRQVVNLFVDIPPGISDETLIAPFMETVYLLQEQYGGYFLKPDLGDKGFNLLIMWGAPIAHENDVERALNFILELFFRTQLPLRAGLSYRMAYAGFIGASCREDYTAYGWGVNLASRMMEHAGLGEYWMDAEVARRAEKHFHVKYLDEYKFKGFADKQKTYLLAGHKELAETVYQGQLVGRKGEIETLASFVEPIKHGLFAGVLAINGEAGIGKSRLVHAFQYSEHFKQLHINWVLCQVDEILRLSFNPFKAWLKKRFELVEGQLDEVNLIAFTRNLQGLIDITSDRDLAAELMRTSSVLAALLNISQPSSFYESLDAKGRYDNTLIALSVLFRAESLVKPLIIFMEDTHWLDEDTRAFLTYFVRTLQFEPEKKYPIAIIATQRPEGDSLKLKDEVSIIEINLGKLSSNNVSSLAENILGHPITGSLHKLLDARADGNPFFAEQILRYLSEQGALTMDAHGNYSANEQVQYSLPVDVRAILIARLDKLSRHVRETVQTASVLGREFEVRVLAEMLRSESGLLSYVKQAESANIWFPLNEIEYIFYHALLREAAYSMQLLARQRDLHMLAVSAMEVVYRDDLEPHYGELAYHAEKAELKEKALNYLTLAGELSLSVYQNHQAVDYFTRALAFVSQDDLHTKFEILIKRVQGHYNIGDTALQSADLDVLEKTASMLMDDRLMARVLMRRSYLCSTLGDFQKVFSFASKAKAIAEEINDPETAFATYMVIPNSLLRTGRIDEAFEFGQKALEFSRSSKDLEWEAKALTALGLIALEKEGPTIARQYQEMALDISRKVGDRYLEAMVLNNAANVIGLSLGDFHTARKYFEEAFAIFQSQGNISGNATALTNLGWVSGILGDYQSSAHYLEQALAIEHEIKNRSEELYVYVNLCAAAIGLGENNEALKWAQKSLELSIKQGDRIGEGWAYFSLGNAYMLNNELDESIRSFTKSIAVRLEINSPVLTAESRASLIEAYLKLESIDAAWHEAEYILKYMEIDKSFEGAEEPLRIYLALMHALEKINEPRIPVILHNAMQLLESQVSKLPSAESKKMFVENVPWRRAIQEIAKKNNVL